MELSERLANQKKYIIKLQLKLRQAICEGATDSQLFPLLTELKAEIATNKILLEETKAEYE